MRYGIPHPIPYQGSKRQLAAVILSFIPKGRFRQLIEPFAGSAAITLAAASRNLCENYLISDVLPPLAGLWKQILETPQDLSAQYRNLWHSQLSDPRARYDEIRSDFNASRDPARLLYLLARCVKNSVRFNPSGEFNQSPDNRRLGVNPDTEEHEILRASGLLGGKCSVRCTDFREMLRDARPEDIVYMDPPYEGTTNGRDRRYFRGVRRNEMVETLTDLNKRGIEFLLSYDGKCGETTYGDPLPRRLNVRRVFINAGRSSQATLNGENRQTLESLYVSAGLHQGKRTPALFHWKEPVRGALLFQ